MTHPTSTRSGFWKCRQCHQPQQGGVSYQVGLKVVCETCAKALRDIPVEELQKEGSPDGIEWHRESIIDDGERTPFNPPRYARVKFTNTAKPISLQDAPQATQEENSQQV